MALEKLNIGSKTANQGVNDSGRLTALEFNRMIVRINEIIDSLNSTVYLTQKEYDELVANGAIESNVEYNILEE